jgi:hypothetical protein
MTFQSCLHTFYKIWAPVVSEDAEFYVDIKNYIYLCAKLNLKELIDNKKLT